MNLMTVSNLEELELMIQKVRKAQAKFASFPQEKVDEIFRAAALAANDSRIALAKMAVEETGMGVLEDKVIKNHFASEYIYNTYKSVQTCGVISEDKVFGLKKIAEPIGIIAGIVPTTNPTSTAIFKALISLKTRNGIIFSPHPRAKKSTCEAARIILEAAVRAGAPNDIIGSITLPSVELSKALMQHPAINLILATGGPGMVKAAYSSGKPAIGVGAGNTPAIIDESAHLKMAVNSILMSKTFDNGVICASEQSVIVLKDVYEEVKSLFSQRGGYILSADEKKKVGEVILKNGGLNADIVGQSAVKIAEMAGVKVPLDTKVLIGETTSTELEEPFSHEKLSPTLALYCASTFESAVKKAARLIELGGIGHTSVLYTNESIHQDRITFFGSQMKTGRIMVNMPASQGAIGDIYNFKLAASLTLGCGSWGGNSVSENVGVKHLLNVKTLAERRENMLWFRVPPKIYFKNGSLPIALGDLAGKKRTFIVTDRPLFNLGYTEKIVEILEELKIECEVFHEVEPDPTIATAIAGAQRMQSFKPDIIIALGGGSPMDAAKIMWVLYEHPEIRFEDLALRFMDIRKRIYQFPKMGEKACMVAIPTTSGTGSEVTPFAVITDEKTGAKYPIADYELTPSMAIIDPQLVLNMPKALTAYSGIDALVHAIEAFVSVLASEYTNGLALEAIRLIFKYLPASYHQGAENCKAREKMHYASTLAGMAFANAFLGVCHSMAHKLGAEFHLPHGLANALLITPVIRYNSTDNPYKLATFPQYKYPQAKMRYARIAEYLKLKGSNPDELVESLISAIEDLKREIGIPDSIAKAGVGKDDFLSKLDALSLKAFDDQCTGANPRYPLVSEIKEIYLESFDSPMAD